MTVTVENRAGVGTYEERWGDNPQIRQQFVIFSDDPADDFVADVKVAFWDPQNVPIMLHGLYRGDPVLNNTTSSIGHRRAWYGEWTWSMKRAPSKDNPVRVSGSTRGGRGTVRRTLQTVGQFTPTGLDPIDFGGAIEADLKSGDVKGCEVVLPAFEMHYEVYVPKDSWTRKFVRFLYQSTGSTNLAKWDYYDIGEGLFLGVDWDYTLGALNDGSTEDLVKATFHFQGSANEIVRCDDIGIVGNETIGTTANAGYLKRGHQHVWGMQLPQEDTGTNATKLVTRQINVERVLPEIDFKKLGFVP